VDSELPTEVVAGVDDPVRELADDHDTTPVVVGELLSEVLDNGVVDTDVDKVTVSLPLEAVVVGEDDDPWPVDQVLTAEEIDDAAEEPVAPALLHT
jgi:hypothetical protein